MRRDAIWTTAATAFGAIFQIGQLMVAARYFSPADFGALAIVNIVLWVVTGFQDMGLSSYCVHIGERDRRTYSTLFWTSSALGAIAAATIVLIAVPTESFYAIPGLARLLLLQSLCFVVLGVSGQYQAQLIRAFRAATLARAELIGRVVAFVVTCACIAALHLGPASIVIGYLAFSIIKLAVMILVAEQDWHPRFEFDRSVAPAAIRYGAYQAASVMINQIRQQLDQIIIGKALGAESLGLYSLAKELLSYPMRFMQPLISRLLLPVFAKAQGDGAALRGAFFNAMRVTTLGSSIAHGGLALFAWWVVEIVYGPKYFGVVPLLAMLLVFATLRPLGFVVGMLAQATGRTDLEFKWNLWSWAITVPGLVAVALAAPTASAFAINLSVTQVLLSIAIYPLFLRPLDRVGGRRYAASWAPALAVSLTMAVAVPYLQLPSIKASVESLRSFTKTISGNQKA